MLCRTNVGSCRGCTCQCCSRLYVLTHSLLDHDVACRDVGTNASQCYDDNMQLLHPRVAMPLAAPTCEAASLLLVGLVGLAGGDGRAWLVSAQCRADLVSNAVHAFLHAVAGCVGGLCQIVARLTARVRMIVCAQGGVVCALTADRHREGTGEASSEPVSERVSSRLVVR